MTETPFPVDIRSENIIIRYPAGCMQLALPEAFSSDDLTIAQIRRLLRYFLEYQYEDIRNKGEIAKLDEYLVDYVFACEETKKQTEKYYSRNYQDPAEIKGNTKLDRAERKARREMNTRMLGYMKIATGQFNRAVKIQSIWKELREK